MEQMLERNVLQDKVELLGSVRHEEVRDVMVRGDIFTSHHYVSDLLVSDRTQKFDFILKHIAFQHLFQVDCDDPITIVVISRLFYNKGTDLLIASIPRILASNPTRMEINVTSHHYVSDLLVSDRTQKFDFILKHIAFGTQCASG
jgi:glycosyltransferase involved in cell wall biosynthesis